ncbi:uncharacterized protein LOC123523665 isoform X2 [Mercenaria mercenaria]|uniref:uncharacterized protein LOC123523665 isoform X2 n=1 Tax=Mercenaria mercenaria TaxID=6596 RepID=UPI00234EB8DF|nr:uncharacterized protein LOC123523665 isoform X2 [Mercenaria mercenaria]
MKVFVPWFPAIEDRINSLALENARRTSTRRTDNTSDSFEGIRKENVAIHKRYDKEKIEVLHSRNRPRIIDSNNISKKKTPFEAGNWFTKDSCMFETKSDLKDENTKGEEKSFDNVTDADDDGVEEFQDTQETFKVVDTEEVPFGNIQIIMSSLDTDFDKAKPADRKFMGNVYIHDEVEDKPIWDVKDIRE